MTDHGEDRLNAVSEFVKPIFVKWEKLRIPYNAVLAVVLVLSHAPRMGMRFIYPLPLLVWLIGAVLANMCFLAGPTAEAYLAWLGLKSGIITAALFVVGILISIPFVVYFIPM